MEEREHNINQSSKNLSPDNNPQNPPIEDGHWLEEDLQERLVKGVTVSEVIEALKWEENNFLNANAKLKKNKETLNLSFSAFVSPKEIIPGEGKLIIGISAGYDQDKPVECIWGITASNLQSHLHLARIKYSPDPRTKKRFQELITSIVYINDAKPSSQNNVFISEELAASLGFPPHSDKTQEIQIIEVYIKAKDFNLTKYLPKSPQQS